MSEEISIKGELIIPIDEKYQQLKGTNFIYTKLSLSDSIDFYLKNYVHWLDYNNSSCLIDESLRVIYYIKGQRLLTIVQADFKADKMEWTRELILKKGVLVLKGKIKMIKLEELKSLLNNLEENEN